MGKKKWHWERSSHSIAPIDDLVLIASYLEALPLLLTPDHCNVCQPLLSCGITCEIFKPDTSHRRLPSATGTLNASSRRTDGLLDAL